jgi:hypothetical protein
VRAVLDSSILVAALATPNPASASRIILAAAAAGVVRYSARAARHILRHTFCSHLAMQEAYPGKTVALEWRERPAVAHREPPQLVGGAN